MAGAPILTMPKAYHGWCGGNYSLTPREAIQAVQGRARELPASAAARSLLTRSLLDGVSASERCVCDHLQRESARNRHNSQLNRKLSQCLSTRSSMMNVWSHVSSQKDVSVKRRLMFKSPPGLPQKSARQALTTSVRSCAGTWQHYPTRETHLQALVSKYSKIRSCATCRFNRLNS